MFNYGGYFNNPFAMNNFSFMPNYSYNFLPLNFSALNFSSYNTTLPFTPSFYSGNYNIGSVWNNSYAFNPTRFSTPSFAGFSPTPTLSGLSTYRSYNSSYSNGGLFSFLNNSSIRTFGATRSVSAASITSTTSTSVRSEGPYRRASLSVSAQGLGPEFLAKVKQIAQRINCDYRDLLGVMNSESGLNSTAVNKNGGATGLIQFMPATAKGMGTTTAALKAMTPLQQLDYVEKFLVQNKKSAGFADSARLSGGDLYSLVFLPGRAKREILTSRGEKYYKHNKGLDLNGDGNITKSELDQRVASKCVNESIFA